jgi:hypothetical protein
MLFNLYFVSLLADISSAGIWTLSKPFKKLQNLKYIHDSANNKTKYKLNNIIEMEKSFFVFPSQTNSLTQHTQQHSLLWSRSAVQLSINFKIFK